jgi:putative protease
MLIKNGEKKMDNKKTELLSPAGNLLKLKTAILYGADAVYAGTPDMSLRTKSEFSLEDLKEGVEFVKKNNKKIYLTLNLFTHNKDIEKLPIFLETVKELKPHGLLIADPGLFQYFKDNAPEIPIHVSTQANVCSLLSVDFWQKQGAKLCVLAREVPYNEIKEIKEKSKDIKIEVFVHGAMCMTYSGRCLLSNFMAERGANQGNCAHSCRWNYKVKIKLDSNKVFEMDLNDKNKDMFDFVLEEEFREGEYYPIEEDEMGSYILNSKDLCLIPVLDDYLDIGIDTMKIEGRNKSEYYAAITARAYRRAIDSYYENKTLGEDYDYRPFLDELYSVTNRGYSLAFHNGRLENLSHNYEFTKTISNYSFLGQVMEVLEDGFLVEIKNFLEIGDVIEFVSPYYLEPIRLRINEIIDGITGEIKSKISPGKKNQTIKILYSYFNLIEIEKIKAAIPKLTVIRKLLEDTSYNNHIKANKVSFLYENNKATESVLNNVKENLRNQIHNNEQSNHSMQKRDYKTEKKCCSLGCNGCLMFDNDEKYYALRDKLKQKGIGKKLNKVEILDV